MFVGIGCLLFVVSIVLLSVAAMIHTPPSPGSPGGSGRYLLAFSVVLLLVSATMMVAGAVLSET